MFWPNLAESLTGSEYKVNNSLKTSSPAISQVYADACKLAIKESKKAKLGVRKPTDAEYPLDCPFLIEQLLDEDFYGDTD